MNLNKQPTPCTLKNEKGEEADIPPSVKEQ